MTKITFKNEKGDGGEYCKSWGVYFEGQEDKFDTIILAWTDDVDMYGEGWTQLSADVCDVIGGGFPKLIDIKNAYHENADKLKNIIKH
jgi:hypothetical protein